MYLLKVIGVIFSILLTVVIVDLINFDYINKKKSIDSISSKMIYVIPAFSFTSKEYREFVYVK